MDDNELRADLSAFASETLSRKQALTLVPRPAPPQITESGVSFISSSSIPTPPAKPSRPPAPVEGSGGALGPDELDCMHNGGPALRDFNCGPVK